MDRLFGGLPPDVPRAPPAHLNLFDFDDLSSDSHGANVEDVLQRVAAWPKNVPGIKDALHCLTAPEGAELGALAAPTRRVSEMLTSAQRSALDDTSDEPRQQLLRRSALLLWRLVTARITGPAPADASRNPDIVHPGELKGMLAQADEVLEQLASADDEELKQARSVLTSAAVDLTGFAAILDKAVEGGKKSKYRYRGRARWVPTFAQERPGLSAAGLGLFAILILAGSYFYPGAERILPTSPFGTVTNAAENGTQMVIETNGMDPKELSKLRKKLWRQGKLLVDIGNDRFLLAPLPEKAPKEYPYDD